MKRMSKNDAIIEDSIDLAQSLDLNSIGAIPITISFFLANKTLSIDQLEELAPGRNLFYLIMPFVILIF